MLTPKGTQLQTHLSFLAACSYLFSNFPAIMAAICPSQSTSTDLPAGHRTGTLLHVLVLMRVSLHCIGSEFDTWNSLKGWSFFLEVP